MRNKIKKTLSRFYLNAINKCKAFFNKLKRPSQNYFSNINPESGIVGTLLVIGIVGLSLTIAGISAHGYIKGEGQNLLAAIITAMADGIYYVAFSLGSFAAKTLEGIVNLEALNKSITRDRVFLSGWDNVKGLANMIIVLGFVVVGIATSLRIREYEAKKLLWPLIAVAILVSFSGLLCGLIIDASNITFNSFIMGAGAEGGTGTGVRIVNQIEESHSNMGKVGDTVSFDTMGEKKQWGLYFLYKVQFAAMQLAVFATFIYLDVILLARYAVLALLFILSPLAFAFWIFPASKKLWHKWWEAFIKWAFIGVGGAFFINMAGQLLDNLYRGDGINDFKMLVVLMFLFVGFKIVKDQSPALANAAIGLAKTAALGVGGLAVAGAMKAGGGALKTTGRLADGALGGAPSKAGQFISRKTGQALEFAGMRAKGTTAQNAEKSMKATSSRIDSMSDTDITKTATSGAYTASGRANKAAAIQNIVKNGRINDLGDTKQQKAAIDYAESHLQSRGIDSGIRKSAVALNPNLGKTPEEVAKAVQNTSPTKAAEWNPNVMTPEVFNNLSQKQMSVIGDKGSASLVNSVKAYKHDPSKGLSGQSEGYLKSRDAMRNTNLTLTPAEKAANMAKYKSRHTQLSSDANYA